VGHRANLLLVEGSEYRLFYSHWCANTLQRDLFWGPTHAAAFIGIQREVDDSGWLDDVWAEGGALLDLDRHHFLLFGGLKLADKLATAEGLHQLNLDEWTEELPSGGFHIDPPAHCLEFWIAADAPDIANGVTKAWPGWKTVWHYDEYEKQLDWTKGLLRFPLADRQALLDRCRQMLLQEQHSSPVDTVKMLIERDREQGHEVQVNPWALREDRLEISEEKRLTILNGALSRL
jgi:hypothetical protein